MTGTPPVRRRLIGAALRRYRDNIGYPLDTPARILECDRSKVSRIETGQRGIRAKELRELLTEYGVPEPEQCVLLAIAQTGRQRGWWQSYADVLPAAAQDYILMESCASQVLLYEPQRVPDLLQTAEYAGAMAAADPAGLEREWRDRLVEVILTRQQAALGERSMRIEVVLGEAALHQAVGGPGVMRAQLHQLATVASAQPPHQDVAVQVLPFGTGAQPGAGSGPLAILRFDDAPSLGVVYVATLSGGVCVEDTDEVARYVRAFAQLRAAARTPAASAGLLREMARD